MERSWYLRLAIVLGTVALAGYLLYPSYFYFFQFQAEDGQKDYDKYCAALPEPFPCNKFNLGLDLQGGVHLVMGVDVNKAVEQRADRMADSLRDKLKDEKVAIEGIDRPRNTADIVLNTKPDTDISKLDRVLRKDFPILEVVGRSGNKTTLALVDDEAQFVRDSAVEQTIKAIRNRADRLGVTEPTIARRGAENILIQLPGLQDPERAIDIIGKTAQLEFKIAQEADSVRYFENLIDLPEGMEKREYTFSGPNNLPMREIYFELPETEEAKVRARQFLEPLISPNQEIAFGQATLQSGAAVKGRLRTYLLSSRPGITGDYLTDAQVQQNPDLPSDYYVTMTFDTKGARIFGELTEQNVRRHMAIVLDETVSSAPIIEEKIPGGTARITLGRSGTAQQRFEEAKDLALVLKAGALPAPVEIREQRRVGETLGKESVQAGATAIAVGGLLVIAFMFIWYKASGFIANTALVLNIVLVLAIMALFEATLTLPGMAGIVLTIGMAVDANVIIFERIKEELRVGKTPRAAIDAGYNRAFSAIVDANITTLIAGVVLMEYGSGPVRGFAVTLIVGISCSMFTAIVVTRLIYDFFSSRRRLQTLSI